MSANNGVIRIGRKGLKKFAFGEEGSPGSEEFQVDVVSVFTEWLNIEDGFRPDEADADGNRPIPRAELPAYHNAAVMFVERLRKGDKNHPDYQPINVGEALDFFARLREEFDKLLTFFRPRSIEKQDSSDSSEEPSTQQRFSVEKDESSPASTS